MKYGEKVDGFTRRSSRRKTKAFTKSNRLREGRNGGIEKLAMKKEFEEYTANGIDQNIGKK